MEHICSYIIKHRSCELFEAHEVENFSVNFFESGVQFIFVSLNHMKGNGVFSREGMVSLVICFSYCFCALHATSFTVLSSSLLDLVCQTGLLMIIAIFRMMDDVLSLGEINDNLTVQSSRTHVLLWWRFFIAFCDDHVNGGTYWFYNPFFCLGVTSSFFYRLLEGLQ